MKNGAIYYLFLAMLVSLTGCWGGADSPEPNVPPVPAMPEATQEGLHTFGCYVDGEEFVSRKQVNFAYAFAGMFGGGGVYDTLQARLNPLYYNLTKYELSIRAPLRDVHRKISKDIYLSIHLDSLESGTFPVKRASYSDNAIQCIYTSNPAPYGTITITRLDTTERIISGLFEFVQPAKGNCVENVITNGRFDLKMIFSH